MKDNNYISYAENDEQGAILHDELFLLQFNVIQGRGILEKEGCQDDDHGTFTSLVDNIMKKSAYIIICISKATVTSYHQAIEINSAMDSKKTIVYIMTDEDFTPQNTPYLNGLVKNNNRWLPGYDEPTIEAALKFFVSMRETTTCF